MKIRFRLLSIFLPIFCVVSFSHAQRNPSTPSNVDLDYFNPANDPHIQWLIADQNKYHLDVGIIRIREGDYSRAIREFRFLLTGFPNHPKGLMLLGSVAKLTKNPALGISYYQRALHLYPQYPITHAQYGNYLVEIGQVGSGLAKLKAAIEMDPKLVSAYVWLAKAYVLKGDLEQAKTAASKARELGYKGKIPSEVSKR